MCFPGLIPGAFGSLVAAAVASQQQQNQVQPNNQMLNPSSLSSTASGMPFTPTSNVASTANLNPLMSGLTSYGGCKLRLDPSVSNYNFTSVACEKLSCMDLSRAVVRTVRNDTAM
jgi:hypothetical protein